MPLLLNFLPFILSLAGFTFLYVIAPNCRVRFKYGFYGALFAAILFELAKYAFAYYLIQYRTYELLYGAFATLPIFFVWIYWVWLITLLGAEVSYAFSVHYQRRAGRQLDAFSQALLWLYHLRLAQTTGQGLTTEQLINVSQHPYAINSSVMIHELKKLNLIQTTYQGQHLLSQNLNDITLYHLIQLLPFPLSLEIKANHPDIKLIPVGKNI